jgi:hypothetical protein
MTEVTTLFHDIEVYLHSVDHETNIADNTETTRLCGRLKRRMERLDGAFSMLHMPYGAPAQGYIRRFELALGQVRSCGNT